MTHVHGLGAMASIRRPHSQASDLYSSLPMSSMTWRAGFQVGQQEQPQQTTLYHFTNVQLLQRCVVRHNGAATDARLYIANHCYTRFHALASCTIQAPHCLLPTQALPRPMAHVGHTTRSRCRSGFSPRGL